MNPKVLLYKVVQLNYRVSQLTWEFRDEFDIVFLNNIYSAGIKMLPYFVKEKF